MYLITDKVNQSQRFSRENTYAEMKERQNIKKETNIWAAFIISMTKQNQFMVDNKSEYLTISSICESHSLTITINGQNKLL